MVGRQGWTYGLHTSAWKEGWASSGDRNADPTTHICSDACLAAPKPQGCTAAGSGTQAPCARLRGLEGFHKGSSRGQTKRLEGSCSTETPCTKR